jgi:hypothetical protein
MNTVHFPTIVLGQAAPEATAPPVTASTGQNPGFMPTAPPASGLAPGAVATTVTFSLLAIVIFIAWLAVKHYKGQLRDIVLGMMIGTLGAGGFVGALTWAVIAVFVKLIQAGAQAISS